MANMYTRDQIQITPVTRDVGLGTETKGTAFKVSAMVIDTSEVINKNGREVKASVFIFLDPSVIIEEGDLVIVTKMFGKDVIGTEKLVLQATRYGSWRQSHWEVYL